MKMGASHGCFGGRAFQMGYTAVVPKVDGWELVVIGKQKETKALQELQCGDK